MKTKPEAAFEEKIIAWFRKQGVWACHLTGPPGWPDVTTIDHNCHVTLYELKSISSPDWIDIPCRDILEPSQWAFPLSVPFEIYLLIETQDGQFVTKMTQAKALKCPTKTLKQFVWREFP